MTVSLAAACCLVSKLVCHALRSGGYRFTEIFAAEWRGVLFRTWNTERPLVFAHIVLTIMLGVCQAR